MSSLKHDVCTKRVMKELKDQTKYTSYEMVPVDDNIYICMVRFGVFSGAYVGQEHIMEVKFMWGSGEVHHFPYDPPLMTFKTPILHPNIGEYPGGAICLDFLKQSGLWSPTCTVLGLVEMIRALLLDPNPSSPQNAKAGTLYTEAKKNKEDWGKISMKYYKEHIKSAKEHMDRFSDKVLEDDKVESSESNNSDLAEDDSEDSSVSSLSMPDSDDQSQSDDASPKSSKNSKSPKSSKAKKTAKKSEKSMDEKSKKDTVKVKSEKIKKSEKVEKGEKSEKVVRSEKDSKTPKVSKEKTKKTDRSKPEKTKTKK
jgi:ubiquitin-protein ligase